MQFILRNSVNNVTIDNSLVSHNEEGNTQTIVDLMLLRI